MKQAVLLFVLICLSTLVCAQKKSHGGDESQLIALERSWNQAELQNAPAAVDLFLSDEFIITQPDGTLMNKKQFMSSIGDKSYHYDQLISNEFKVRIFGEAAVVTGSYHEKGRDGHVPFDRWGRFTDTWLFLNGKWICVASHDSLPTH